MGLDITGLGSVFDLVKDVADKIWPDPAERDQALLKAQELDNQLAQGQLAINQAEAASSSVFVAGWRPFIGWVCGAAFAYHMILQPLITYVMAMFHYTFPLPEFNISLLGDTLTGMLGLGSLRTIEKMADKGHLPWQK